MSNWKIHGIEGKDKNPPRCVGTQDGGVLIILGSAGTFQDWGKLREMGIEGDLMAVNDIGQYIPEPLTDWVSMTKYMGQWIGYRKDHGHNRPLTHTHKTREQCPVLNADVAWGLKTSCNNSGVLGIFVGLLLGYNKIILCGIPADKTSRFFDPPWQKYDRIDEYKTRRRWYHYNEDIFQGKVRSMSGNTCKWLGEATKEWSNT